MAQDILESVLFEANKHNAKQIQAIEVKIRDGHFVESDSLQFCLQAAAKGSIADSAQIEVKLEDTTDEYTFITKEPIQITLELE